MIKFSCKNVDAMVIGEENGLNLQQEFDNYKDKIAEIITDLNKRKDKNGQKLQWMNLAYNDETIWYVKEYAAMVKDLYYRGKIFLANYFSALLSVSSNKVSTKLLLTPNLLKQIRQFLKLIYFQNVP